MSGRLHGRVAIVTGAGNGIGAAIASRFVSEGASVVVADIDGIAAQKVASSLGSAAIAVKVDVAVYSDVLQMVEEGVRRFRTVDILVNNAGTTHLPMAAIDVDESTFDRVLAVNFKSLFNTIRAIAPVFKRAGNGSIVNIGSVGGLRPRPGLVWYGASKGALANATKGLAIELAPLNIRVNNISPSVADTALLNSFVGVEAGRKLNDLLNTIPLGRLATSQDVASAAVFLASEEASFVTGADLCVDGGRNI